MRKLEPNVTVDWDAVKKARVKAGYTWEMLSLDLGYAKSTLSGKAVEGGRMPESKLRKLAALLNTRYIALKE